MTSSISRIATRGKSAHWVNDKIPQEKPFKNVQNQLKAKIKSLFFT